MPRALITGGSAGLGLALATGLAERDWDVVITGRDESRLNAAARQAGDRVRPIAGDVTDPGHRAVLVEAVGTGLDLLVNNASTLGVSPLLPVLELDDQVLRDVWETNVVAPVTLTRALWPLLHVGGAVINITSDAAADHYETWGAYAASKAALEHLTLTLAVEAPDVRWWTVDPGDMRTQMHQDAFPGQDISDRPLPESVVPAFLALLDARPPSGRHQASDLVLARAGA
ncbi:SDR family NAD(P)-dependent oxidoreductase [Aeromicrobium ginsengisoli]|uniref:SDR family oxidoreductase n=1 Tax=Aeromicrobium ginsengisoli TaxID=363867 RepID=A0A5M4FFK2_9ACTN|nr:SDR family oxidoreductase [Aeromicrobium ginsengisoli]KAA1397906.1 SDR family oxidoreductase [Aeromicrobium ginsengisoli]